MMHRPTHPGHRAGGRPGRGRALLTTLLLLAAAAPVSAQPEVDARPNERTSPRDTIARARYSDPIDILSAGVEFVASAGDGTFFDEYSALGGKQSGLDTYLAPLLTGRLAITDRLRLTAYASYHATGFEESYDVRRGEGPMAPAIAGVAESFRVMAVPLAVGIEFAPIRTQFTSYVGVGAGAAMTRSRWRSSVQYTNGGYLRPQSNSESFGVAPVARAYAGVDLRFDRGSVTRAAFRGIFLEASYMYLPIARDYFGAIRSGSTGIEEGPTSDDATLYLGGLSFTFGLNLQVLRR